MIDTKVEGFNQNRPLLFGIAWRMLGNTADAEDILQEAFLRWQRTVESDIRSPKAFLVTIVTRLCLNHLDSARVKKEQLFGANASLESFPSGEVNPAEDVDLAGALDAAFSVVLKCLSPVERAVFLLREVFECDYAEVSRIVEKSEENCRQILRRARERIAGRDHRFEVKLEEQEAMLQEFLNATATGELNRLAMVLAAEVTLVCDGENLGAPAPSPIHGAAAISCFLIDRARDWMRSGARLQKTAIREVPLLLAYCNEKLLSAFALIFQGRQVQTIYVITCPVRLRSLSLQCPPPNGGQDNIS